MILPKSLRSFAAALAPAALLIACGGGADSSVVARVGEDPITVDEVVAYMQQMGYGATRADVERAVDELVDIELIVDRAEQRHALTPAESLQLDEWEKQLLYNQFRDDVIFQDVTVDEERLREWYDENVGEEVSARHILVESRADAPDSVRQAARAKADSLLAEVKAGADFAALAEEHSDDAGSAQRGGSLGYFQQGQMVPAFDRVAFATPVGEIAPEVVETQFGFHVLKVEDKRKQSFDEVRDEIEEQLAAPERRAAERAYLTDLMETSNVEFLEGAIDRFLELVAEASTEAISGEDRQRQLVVWNGGEITLGELWDLYVVLPESNRRQIAQLDQEGMVRALSQMVQQRIALERAQASETELDTLRQRQYDERRDRLLASAYLNAAMAPRFAVSDQEVRRYYDEHLEFYTGQEFDAVREQIRATLTAEKQEAMASTDTQREFVSTVADSQAQRVEVTRNPDRYEAVLEALRASLAGEGQEASAR